MGLCASNANSNVGMALSTGQIASKRSPGEFVVWVGAGTNLPNMDESLRRKDLSDCYAKLQVKDINGVPCSGEFVTQVRKDTLNPTWNTYAAFPIQPLPDDVVFVTILDHDDLTRDDYIGHLEIPVNELQKFSVAKPCDFVLTMKTHIKPTNINEPSTVSLGVMQNSECCNPQRGKNESFSVEKEFWLIRHGESKWNEATEQHSVGGLMGNDHPLNSTGIDQALNFHNVWTTKNNTNETMTDAEQGFLKAERVIASPLTRAIQTAVLTCHGHQHLGGKGNKNLVLKRNLREKKNKALSLDTVGQAVGDGIAKRVLEQLIEEKWKEDPETAQKYMQTIDYNDCNSTWWTGISHGDSKGMLTSRYDELWAFLKYMKEKSAVLVGHSLFFREMQQRYLDEEYCGQDKKFTDRLKAHKLDNASCLYIRVRFPKPESMIKMDPTIVQAELVFGSRLKEKHEPDEDDKNEAAAAKVETKA